VIFFLLFSPLENQSYSNNAVASTPYTSGRANPILPRFAQDSLERFGVIKSDEYDSGSPVRSSQAIDLKKGRVRNVVSFKVRNPFHSTQRSNSTLRGSVIVDVIVSPAANDKRQVNVKFDSCRVMMQNTPLDVTFPLGPIGPTGWLRTTYIDDAIRITRGHKGSVFILSRTSSKVSKKTQ